MTKNRSMRIAVLVLALALITCCFVGTTFAKYTSSATGSDSVTVAKWSIIMGENDLATDGGEMVFFNLFETINDTGNTADEGDVADARIAPGTAGSFAITLENASEVNAKVSIDFDVEANGVPLLFKVGEGEWKATLDDITDAALAMDGNADYTVSWMWAYETDADSNAENGISGDVTDTSLGINTPTVTVSAKLTVTQVD
ncbi:MAG: hypothetical protein J6L90_03335 [Clostridia bacterium]|nr:hypothetical protein [Clostridia bacterium]